MTSIVANSLRAVLNGASMKWMQLFASCRVKCSGGRCRISENMSAMLVRGGAKKIRPVVMTGLCQGLFVKTTDDQSACFLMSYFWINLVNASVSIFMIAATLAGVSGVGT
jgi:hypothetical protein